MIDPNNLPARLGDYELRELISDDGKVLTFSAIQSVIHRDVILSLVKPDSADEKTVEQFLDSARAKAKVKEGRICSVFEATHSNGLTYYTQELPAGTQLDKIKEEGRTFDPLQVAKILKELASSQIYYEKQSLKVSPWTPSSVFIDKNGDTRFLNLVESGSRGDKDTTRDEHAVGDYFPTLVTPNVPGTTRVLTLCSWMTGGPQAPRGLNWSMVLELCDTIIDQLEAADLSTTTPSLRTEKRKPGFIRNLFIGGALLLILGAASLIVLKNNLSGSDSRPAPKNAPPVPRTSHRTDKEVTIYNSETHQTSKLSVDIHEVTIESYERFLQFVTNLTPYQIELFRLEDQPESKTSYVPRDWMAMLAAAQTGGMWNGQKLTPLSPVTNVDLWDAKAYAKWENRRLMTQPEWKALVGDNNAKKPKRDKYTGVDGYYYDKTESGIYGLAGGVSEWTDTQSVNLAMPMSGKKPLICGGSYANAGDADFEDHMDSDLSVRPDVGFRTVRDLD